MAGKTAASGEDRKESFVKSEDTVHKIIGKTP